jgi:hypothetical protein
MHQSRQHRLPKENLPQFGEKLQRLPLSKGMLRGKNKIQKDR